MRQDDGRDDAAAPNFQVNVNFCIMISIIMSILVAFVCVCFKDLINKRSDLT